MEVHPGRAVTASSPECHLVFSRGWPSMVGARGVGSPSCLSGLVGSQRRTGGAALALIVSRRAAGSWLVTRPEAEWNVGSARSAALERRMNGSI